MAMTYWFVFFGFLLFAIGSIAVAHGGAVVGRELGLSPLTIGLTVVVFATSTPELFVMLRATAADAPDLAVGGIVGSAILTLTFMLGLGALIRPLASPPKVVFREGGMLLLASLAFVFFSHNEVLARRDGAVLLLLFVGYAVLVFTTDWRRAAEHSVSRARAEALADSRMGLSGGLFLATLGLVAVVLGAHFTVAGSIALARDFGLPEYAVGLTVVALAVSVPEFFVILGGSLAGRTNITVGQVVGANIFNLLFVCGLAATIAPLPIARPLVFADNLALVVASVALPLIAAMRWRLSRPRGLFLILCYGGYLAFLAVRLNYLSHSLPRFW